jgi:small subunit ribosomal protein S17e
MKRIQRGPVRGISLKLQEEERERRMDFVPEVSAVDATTIELDADSMEMLKAVGLGSLPGVKAAPAPGHGGGAGAGGAAVPGYAGPNDRERRRERRTAA